jgi:hypothetical protein
MNMIFLDRPPVPGRVDATPQAEDMEDIVRIVDRINLFEAG